MRSLQKGFTIPELISVITVSGIFVSIILFFMISYWRYGFMLEADLDTFVTRLNAQDYLRVAVGDSTGLINQNSIADANANNPDPNDPSNTHWMIIHAIPGNTPVPSSSQTIPLIYFKRASVNTAGSVILNGTQPYEDEYVLYLDGSTKSLLLRSLANASAADNRVKTSCPVAVATSTCPADKIVAADLSSIDTKYFSRTGVPIDWTSIWDPDIGEYAGPDFPTVEVLELALNITKKPLLQTTSATANTTIIRVALRNT